MLQAGLRAPYDVYAAPEGKTLVVQDMCGGHILGHNLAHRLVQSSEPHAAGYGSTTSTGTAPAYSQHQNATSMDLHTSSSTFLGLTQLQLPIAAVTSQLGTAVGSTTAARVPSGISGMTSLYGKLRNQAVQPAAALMQPTGATSSSSADADAVLQPAGSLSVGSAAGSSAYGWQRQKVLGSAYSSSNASSILQAGAGSIQQAVPFQYSMYSTSKASSHSSRSTSSTCSRSTTASVHADQGLRSSLAATTNPLTTHESATCGPVSSTDQRVLDTFGLSASSGSDQQQLLSLLMPAQQPSARTEAGSATAASAGHAAGPGALLAAATDTAADSELLQQLQQLLINETAAAQSGPFSSISSSSTNNEQQLLMQQLRDLQGAQGFSSSNTAAPSYSTDPYSRADASTASTTLPELAFQTFGPDQMGLPLMGSSGAAPASDTRFQLPTDPSMLLAALQYQGLPQTNASASSVARANVVGDSALLAGQQQGAAQQINSQQPALAELLSILNQQQQMRCMSSSSDVNSFSGLCSSLSSSLTTGAAAPLGYSNSMNPGHAAVADAVAALQHKILMSNTLPPGADQGVFGSLAGLAAATAAAGMAGLGVSGKQTLQAGPGNNPLYKTEMCRTWMETGGCRYGARCQFAHGPQELRAIQRHPKYKTQACRTFSVHGSCPYGDRCNFIHDRAPQAGQALQISSTGSTGITCSTAVFPAGSTSSTAVLRPQGSDSTTSISTSGAFASGSMGLAGSCGAGSFLEPCLSFSPA